MADNVNSDKTLGSVDPEISLSLDSIKGALDSMNPLSELLTWTDSLREIKSGVAGTAMLVERFLKLDTINFLDNLADGTATAMNGLTSSGDKVQRIISESADALKDMAQGREEVLKIETFAVRCDAMTTKLWDGLGDGEAVRSRRRALMSALGAERDARLPDALERSGIAAVHSLGTHLAILGDALANSECITAADFAEECALTQALRTRVRHASAGAAMAVSISLGGDISVFGGLSGSVSFSLSLYLSNVETRLALYEAALQAAGKQALELA